MDPKSPGFNGFSSSSSTKSPISRQSQVCGCYLVAHIGNLQQGKQDEEEEDDDDVDDDDGDDDDVDDDDDDVPDPKQST